MLVTIASIDQKEKLTFVTTTDGQKLRCWNDKAARFGFEQNASFEIETEATQYGTHIKAAKRAAASTVAQPFVSGAFRPDDAPPLPAGCTKDEQIFVQGIVQSLIRSGEVTLDNVEGAVTKIRGVWRRTLGRAAIQQQMQAAE